MFTPKLCDKKDRSPGHRARLGLDGQHASTLLHVLTTQEIMQNSDAQCNTERELSMLSWKEWEESRTGQGYLTFRNNFIYFQYHHAMTHQNVNSEKSSFDREFSPPPSTPSSSPPPNI